MTGRVEHEQQIDKKINKILKEYPQYIKVYNVYLQSQVTHNTRQSYISTLLRFLEYLKTYGYDINDITIFRSIKPSFIIQYMVSIQKKNINGELIDTSSSYQIRQLCAVKMFFKYLKLDGYIESNPCDGQEINIRNSKKERKIISLTPDEVKQINTNVVFGVGTNHAKKMQWKWRKRDYAIFQIGFKTGLRVSALSEINIDDINFRNKTIHVIEKRNFERDVPISDDTMIAIEEWMEDRELLLNKSGNTEEKALFISNRRKRMTQNAINCIVKKYGQEVEPEITAHKMRSTCATNMYKATQNIRVVQEALGHGKPSTTAIYIANDKREVAAAVNRMDKIYGN